MVRIPIGLTCCSMTWLVPFSAYMAGERGSQSRGALTCCYRDGLVPPTMHKMCPCRQTAQFMHDAEAW